MGEVRMPRYMYRCDKCEKMFDVFHSITIKYKSCEEVGEEECKGALTRIPSFSSYIKKQKNSAGKMTNEFIEKASEELKEQKDKLVNREYDA
tara:strand:- start:390 stop:665 length:276 start_codon:yes stop_codon:yes gene_type:complete